MAVDRFFNTRVTDRYWPLPGGGFQEGPDDDGTNPEEHGDVDPADAELADCVATM